MFKNMIKNPLRLTVKLFIILWVLLLLQVVLKLTYNYWQPYVIPTPQLEAISNFIDTNRWLEIIFNCLFYTINAIIFTLCAIQQWWFKSRPQIIISLIIILGSFIVSVIFGHSSILSFIVVLGLPLILNYRKWIWILLTFILSNVFTMLSLWLEGFTNVDNMNYVIGTLFQLDYYIMLVLNYILFNFIRMRKEVGKNG